MADEQPQNPSRLPRLAGCDTQGDSESDAWDGDGAQNETHETDLDINAQIETSKFLEEEINITRGDFERGAQNSLGS